MNIMNNRQLITPAVTVCLTVLLWLGPAATGYTVEKPSWSLANRLYGDRKARKVGDILTIQIIEETSSTKDSEKESEKKFNLGGKISFNSPQIDGSTKASWTNVTIPSWSLSTDRKFSGGGKMANAEKLSGTPSARVVEVLPNDNLIIEGRRRVVVQGESAQFILTGMVRPDDITRDNVVKSTAIADAAIQYISDGSIAKNQQKGLLPSLWDWINPF
jgi:flagellar L-ring protein precursor FlgH